MKAQICYTNGSIEIERDISGVLRMPDGTMTLVRQNGGFRKFYPNNTNWHQVTVNVVENDIPLIGE